jgi:hypothetical protein
MSFFIYIIAHYLEQSVNERIAGTQDQYALFIHVAKIKRTSAIAGAARHAAYQARRTLLLIN